MRMDLRAASRLRAKTPVNPGVALAPVLDALGRGTVDLSRVRLVCDWVQYAHNFRGAVDGRPVCRGAFADGDQVEVELAVDLRQHDKADLAAATTAELALTAGARPDDRVYLEEWVRGSASAIWDFNALYWRELSAWEQATGAAYEQALPGGQSDARNVEAARELIRSLFEVWDDLAERGALPAELFVAELGVGNGNQARTWLDEFVELDRAHGRSYYGRLHYLMCDYSEHVLALARDNVAAHAERVSSLVLDAASPATSLGFLRSKIFLVYVSNVYDNLPTDELARIDDQIYRVEVRARLDAEDARRIAGEHGIEPDALVPQVRRLTKLGPQLLAEAAPEQFASTTEATLFWQQVWAALRLSERYVPLDGLDLYEIAPGIGGTMLRGLLASGGDVRMHVSNGAVGSFAQSLALLHPYGRLLCHDIFATDVGDYARAFKGPGKYDGSVVNWVNGALLRHVGQRAGYDVSIEAFAHRPGANVTTLTARARD